MRITLTGANGYLGLRIIDLLRKNHSITALDNQVNIIGKIRNIKVVKEDLLKVKDVEQYLEKDTDVIIHLAAIVGIPPCENNKEKAYSLNVDVTKKIGDFCKNNFIKMVFPTTLAVYGNTSNKIITEEMKHNPLNYYGYTKSLAEIELIKKAKNSFPLTIFIITNIYGLYYFDKQIIYGNYGVINNFYESIKNKKTLLIHQPDTTVYNFIHVKDVARAFTLGLKMKPNSKPEIDKYMLGGQDLFSVKDIFHIFQDFCNRRGITFSYKNVKSPQERIREKQSYTINTNKIRTKLGYKNTINVKEGILEMIETLK